jgi:thiamine biosynthesis lipoprotein
MIDMLRRPSATLLLLLLVTLACAPNHARQNHDGTIKRTWTVIGAPFSVQIFGVDPQKAEQAIQAAQAEIKRLETLADPRLPDSDTSRINSAAGNQPVTISPELFEILQLAQEVSVYSDGAFDVTFAGVGRLWNFGDPKAPLPTDAQIAAALPMVGYRHLRLDPARRTAFLDKREMKIGLGALAPGWLADAVVAIFHRQGIMNAIVDASGDMLATGSKSGRPWRIGIQHPRRPQGENYAVLEVVGTMAVATSGDYERFIIRNGVRYHHVIDPHTGRPAPPCQSVTILGPQAALSDALATTVMVLGPERGLAMLEKYYPQCDALIIDAAGREHTSPAFISRTHARRIER